LFYFERAKIIDFLKNKTPKSALGGFGVVFWKVESLSGIGLPRHCTDWRERPLAVGDYSFTSLQVATKLFFLLMQAL